MTNVAALPIITPRTLLGLRTGIISNVHYINDDQIIYPVGSLLAVDNVAEGHQKFIRLPERGRFIRQLLISANKRLIAVSEDGTEKPLITIYDSSTLKKKRTLTIPGDREVTANFYAVIAFTQDSKNMIAITGDPDWALYSFKIERGKIESSTRAINANGTGTVTQISCNPNDNNMLALAGQQLIRIMACTEYSWRQFGFSKADTTTVTSVAWLSQDRLIAGTIEGKIFVLDSGDLKAVYWAGDMPAVVLKQKDDIAVASQTSLSAVDEKMYLEEGEDYQIRNILVVSRGFIFGFRKGTIHVFEKETPHKYVSRNVYFIPDRTVFRDNDSDLGTSLNQVNYICTNPSQDRILVTCVQHQIYIIKLWGHEIYAGPETVETTMGLPLHHGKIGGLAICSWRPIFLTSGEWDRTLRLWNYENITLEICKEYQEDIFDVALHPTGLYALVGFSDKLRFMTILLDGFAKTRTFNIRRCKKCSFSSLGHLFAAANGNVIQVYSTVSFQNIYVLKGHSGRITGMTWTANDQKMASCGADGAVYEWDVPLETRASEVIIKECLFSGASISSDGKSIFAVGSDGQLRLLVASNVSRELTLAEKGIDGVLLSKADQMLFAAANEGAMYSIKLPLLDRVEYNEFVVHVTPITKMVITFDDKIIITCAEDGSICIWKILNAEGKQIKLDKDFKESTDILISREELQVKLNHIKDLTQRTHEILTEHSYQMRQNDVNHNLRMKEVHEGYCSAIEELKEKNEQLEAEHVQEIQNINMEITKLKTGHEQFVQKLEANYNEKLIVEYDKYLRLEEKMSRMRMNYEQRLEELTNAKRESEEQITNDFLQKLREKEVHLEEVLIQTQQKVKEHELIKQQIEDDADREIYELKTEHEKELKEEQDINVRLRGETGIIKKKLSNAQKEIEDLKHNVYSLQNEHVKFKAIIVGLERDIADLKKEILERDATIQDKERRIYELKRKNQELEKFKFILDFKIKELKSQIEPRERTIREQTEQINDMVRELENLQRVVINLDLQIGELKEKLHSADAELRREVDKNRTMKNALKTIRMDIHQASGLVQDIPKLTKALKEMYHKYNADKDFAATQQEDVEVKNEFLRQREFLERTVRTLKQQASGGPITGVTDKMRLVEENATLIEETNILRADLKVEEKKSKKLESILGLSSKYMLPKVAQKLMSDAVATREEIESEFMIKLKDREARINALKEENARLLSKIAEENEENTNVTSTDDFLRVQSD